MTALKREMGFTRVELLYCMREAFGDAMTVDGEMITVRMREGSVQLVLSAERERRIAMLRLPYLEVEIDFGAVHEAAAFRFLERFDSYTRRGGG
jgi:hypothetical protein